MKKLNNKILIISFLVLSGIFVLSKIFRSPTLSSNLDADAFEVDTAKITGIHIQPKIDSLKELRLVKEKNKWFISRAEVSANVRLHRIKSLMAAVAQLKPERIVSRKKDKWRQYNVDDSTSTLVSFLDEKNELLSLKVGNEANGITYVRIADEEEIYAMSGSLQEQFNKSFNDWRDPSFIHLQKEKLVSINFQYPADSGFVIEKKGKEWFIENSKIDSVQLKNYLDKISIKEHTVFADKFKPSGNPGVTITFRNDSNAETVVKGWKQSFYQWVLNSNLQPETYFLDEGPKLANELFVRKKDFVAKQ